jgi:Protein of unknown function (DUF3237)
MTDSRAMSDTATPSTIETAATDGPASSLTVSPELTIRVTLAPPQMIGAVPLGVRVVGGVATGTVAGPRINGTIVGPGADWMLIGADGYGRVDVRLQIETDDGALVYVRYEGLLELNEASSAALLDPTRETAWEEQYFRTTPRFETADERYAWLNRTVFVARGRVRADGIEYEVFRVD